jgi:hypothetical protein
MANIRVAYALSSVLLATPAAATVSAGVSTHSITALAQPNQVIAVTAFVVPMEYLEEQTVTMSDLRVFDINKVLIDVVTATDVNNVAFDITATAVDSVAIVENSVKIFSGTVDFDPSDPDVDPDPINIADADVKGIGKTLTEALTASDVDVKDIGQAPSDAVTASETINTKDVGKSLTDATAAADTINQFNTGKVVADSVSATEAAALDVTKGNIAETVTAADTSFRSPELAKTEAVTASDAFGPFNIGKNPSDSATIVDAINTISVDKVLTDSVTMTEFVAKTPGYAFDYDVTDADADPDPVSMADAQAFSLDTTRSDSVSATDAAAKSVTKPDLTDSVTGSDAIVLAASKVLTDSATASEAMAFSPAKVLTDSVSTPTDAINTFTVGKGLTDTATATDVLNLFAISKVLTDSVTMAESISTTLILGQTTPLYPDYVSMADGNGFVFHRYTTNVPDYTEVLGGADSLLNSDYMQSASDSHTHENYTGLINGPGLLLTAPLISGEFITYADTSGAGLVVNFHYTDASDRTVGGYYFNQTPIL